jgi:hypothetical protein
MIKVKGHKVYFTGKDAKTFKEAADSLGLSTQDLLTGCLWEKIMQEARNGTFKKAKKGMVA